MVCEVTGVSGNSPVTGEIPAQRPVTRSFDVFLDLRLNKRLSKQSWCWWFETPSCPLWRHCNVFRNWGQPGCRRVCDLASPSGGNRSFPPVSLIETVHSTRWGCGDDVFKWKYGVISHRQGFCSPIWNKTIFYLHKEWYCNLEALA